MRNRRISSSRWVILPGCRGSCRQAAKRSARFRRRSTSWNSRRPPSADVHRSSMTAEIGLSPTGDRLGRISVSSVKVGGGSRGLGLGLTTKSYARSWARATPTAFVNNPGEVTKVAPQQAIKNLGAAFKRFFEGKAKYPRFKKKGI